MWVFTRKKLVRIWVSLFLVAIFHLNNQVKNRHFTRMQYTVFVGKSVSGFTCFYCDFTVKKQVFGIREKDYTTENHTLLI